MRRSFRQIFVATIKRLCFQTPSLSKIWSKAEEISQNDLLRRNVRRSALEIYLTHVKTTGGYFVVFAHDFKGAPRFHIVETVSSTDVVRNLPSVGEKASNTRPLRSVTNFTSTSETSQILVFWQFWYFVAIWVPSWENTAELTTSGWTKSATSSPFQAFQIFAVLSPSPVVTTWSRVGQNIAERVRSPWRKSAMRCPFEEFQIFANPRNMGDVKICSPLGEYSAVWKPTRPKFTIGCPLPVKGFQSFATHEENNKSCSPLGWNLTSSNWSSEAKSAISRPSEVFQIFTALLLTVTIWLPLGEKNASK